MYVKKARVFCKVLLLFSVVIFLASCLSWVMEKPSFVLRGVSLRPLSLTDVNLLLDLDVQNPNSFDLNFKSFEYTVYLKNEEIGNGRLEKELRIPSSATTRIQAPVAAKFKDLSGSLKSILTEGDLPYKIAGKVVVKTALGSRQFPFSSEGRINLK
ncbi:MAG: LEA type 2 family protein [Syntrophaceae bacterium]|nr:LEA type 2 family protein [Syntrophaceae bacterium]